MASESAIRPEPVRPDLSQCTEILALSTGTPRHCGEGAGEQSVWWYSKCEWVAVVQLGIVIGEPSNTIAKTLL